MPNAVSKDDYPHLNKAARRALYRQQEAKRRHNADVTVRDGYEVFLDPAYYDMWCVRPVGSRDFNDTVHVVHREQADLTIDWLVGKREDIPFTFLHDARDRGLLAHWKGVS